MGVESSYFIPPIEKQREKYAESYKEIDLFKTELSDIERRKQQILDMVRLVKPDITETQIDGLKNILAKVRSESEVEDLTRKGLENIMSMLETPKRKKCEDDHCQKVIDEKELSNLIEKGWRSVSVLPSGKVVVTNE